MTENNEYNTVEFNDISGKPKGIDDGIYESPIIYPWSNAPENVYFYEKIIYIKYNENIKFLYKKTSPLKEGIIWKLLYTQEFHQPI